MRLYFEFIKNALIINSTYRISLLLSVFNRILGLLISVSIWKALYNGTSNSMSNIGMVSLKDMIMYSIISSMISVFISNEVIGEMNNKIKSGQIALDLLKPMNYKAWQFCKVIGKNMSSIVLELLPILFIGGSIYGFFVPKIGNLLLFLIALINGVVLNFLITYILGILGFWYLEVWHFDRLLNDLIRLFSGAWIPLWFFPKALISVSAFLPFKFIYYAPTTIYLSKTDFSESIIVIGQQLLWILGLFIIERLLWKKGIKKLVIQGG